MPSPSLSEPPPPSPALPGAPAAPKSAPRVPLVGVLLPGASAGERVAGVPVGARAAILLERAGCSRVLAPEPRDRLGPRARRVEALASLPDEGQAVVVAGDLVFDKALLERLVASVSSGGVAATRSPAGMVVAGPAALARELVQAHERGGLEAVLAALPADARLEPAPGLFLPAATAHERSAATSAIVLATGKSVDGPLTQLFDRRISQSISRYLVPLPITPNLMTTVSLAIGLTGAALLASTETTTRILGAATFVLATIVDGCDGEIARSKLLESSFGRLYDTGVDIAVNVCVFVGISVGVWREFLGVPEVWTATVLLVAGGILASAAAETVRRLLPRPPAGSVVARVDAWAEKFATLEWSYLVLALALVGELPFFFWGAAIGANVFALVYFTLGVISWLRV